MKVITAPFRFVWRILSYTLFFLPTLIIRSRKKKRQRHEEVIAAIAGR